MFQGHNFVQKKTVRKSTFAIFLKTLKNLCFMSQRRNFYKKLQEKV